jgi:hypothetical protein
MRHSTNTVEGVFFMPSRLQQCSEPIGAIFIWDGEFMDLQQITWLITILSFIGGIAIFLFKKIVIEPLQKSIDSLNTTLRDLKLSTDKRLDLIDGEIDILKEKTFRHDEQIKTLFSK